MVKGSSVPARNKIETLPTFWLERTGLLQRRPVHSGQNVSKDFSLLAGTEEPFTIHAIASWEAPASLKIYSLLWKIQSFH